MLLFTLMQTVPKTPLQIEHNTVNTAKRISACFSEILFENRKEVGRSEWRPGLQDADIVRQYNASCPNVWMWNQESEKTAKAWLTGLLTSTELPFPSSHQIEMRRFLFTLSIPSNKTSAHGHLNPDLYLQVKLLTFVL